MKKKILFLIDSLTGGGAERVLVNLVNNMDLSVYDVTVETMFFDGVNARFLNPGIKLISKNAPHFHGISHILKYIPDRLLYRYFIGKAEYDVMVAFIQGASEKVIAGSGNFGGKKIVWLHAGDIDGGTYWKFYPSHEKTIASYASYDSIVAVSASVKEAFNESFSLGDKVTVRYNVNDTEKIKKLAAEDFSFGSDKFQIVSMGRLSNEKRFDRLINIGARLKAGGLSFEIHIYGRGEQQEKLSALIKEKKVEDVVFLDGFTDNPYRILAKTDLFVCSSYQEGMSTVVSEAIILGVPVVSTDVSGAREVLGDNNEYGIVTGNSEEELYTAVKAVLDDPVLYDKYKAAAGRRSAFFDTGNAVSEIVGLF